MDKQRRIVLQMGACVVGVLGAAIALAGAHDASLLRAGKVVRQYSDAGYFYTVRETPVKPDEPFRRDGTFPSGYYYVCTVSKAGLPLSSYTLVPEGHFKADTVQVEPLHLVRRKGLMTSFDFESNGPAYEVVCRNLSPDKADPNPDFRWQVLSASGR